MAKECPIDQTKLSAFNQYELQNATICRSCAKKLGLVGMHQSMQLANAAHALITVSIAEDYINSGKKIDYRELKNEYKKEVASGDAPSGMDMFKSALSDAESSAPLKGSDNTKDEEAEEKPITDVDSIDQTDQIETQPVDADDVKATSSDPTTVVINNVIQSPKESKQHKALRGITCPKCGSANVQLVDSSANIKRTKKRVSLNLNPLHPLTPFSIKEKKVKKHDKLKTTTAVLTAGMSATLTGGIRSNKSLKYHCQNCGKVFYKK